MGATAAGSRTLAAEVSSSGVFDPTSTPGNGGAEDDRAVATFAVAGPGGPPGTSGAKLNPRGLTIAVARAPKRGRVRSLTVTGRLVLPRVRPAPRCTGKVRVRALAGTRVLASRTVSLKARRGVCRFSAVLRPKKLRTAKQISVNATFLGNTQLRPRAAKVVKVRVVRR